MDALYSLLFLFFLAAAYFACHRFWKRDAQRIALEWCVEHHVKHDNTYPIEFYMGGPAHVGLAGVQDGILYWYRFRLYSSLLNLPPSIFRVWGKVVLENKFPL